MRSDFSLNNAKTSEYCPEEGSVNEVGRFDNVAVRACDGGVSMVRRVDEVSSTISWALPGKSDYVLSRS